MGFDYLKCLYKVDIYFPKAFEACVDPIIRDRNLWSESMLQEGLIFKNS